MRVPHEDKIIHQTFNSKKIEFVWKFNDLLMTTGILSTGKFYIDVGYVDDNNDRIGPVWWADFPSINEIENVYLWSKCEYPPTYEYFSNGKDLVPLIEDVVEYLK